MCVLCVRARVDIHKSLLLCALRVRGPTQANLRARDAWERECVARREDYGTVEGTLGFTPPSLGREVRDIVAAARLAARRAVIPLTEKRGKAEVVNGKRVWGPNVFVEEAGPAHLAAAAAAEVHWLCQPRSRVVLCFFFYFFFSIFRLFLGRWAGQRPALSARGCFGAGW